MSFLGGAECSTGANPLSQFTKHVQDDKSLQRDRLVGRGPGGMHESMRSQQMGGGSDGVSGRRSIRVDGWAVWRRETMAD
jgi:peroxin-5